MFVIPLVLLLGTGLNVANTLPQNLNDAEAALIQQIKHPCISPADYTTLNK